ncbi:hypothetical protein Pelo_14690 [Pelomyxa schiedti]|nr:hypothetical protein Pelo_14690 [Pelomyxa schiedti]
MRVKLSLASRNAMAIRIGAQILARSTGATYLIQNHREKPIWPPSSSPSPAVNAYLFPDTIVFVQPKSADPPTLTSFFSFKSTPPLPPTPSIVGLFALPSDPRLSVFSLNKHIKPNSLGITLPQQLLTVLVALPEDAESTWYAALRQLKYDQWRAASLKGQACSYCKKWLRKDEQPLPPLERPSPVSSPTPTAPKPPRPVHTCPECGSASCVSCMSPTGPQICSYCAIQTTTPAPLSLLTLGFLL